MLDKFVANLLTTYLGKYIANLDKRHVKVSLWNGSVVLTDLQLKTNALRGLKLPIAVKTGKIGELTVIIPWTRLQSESVKVIIKNVVLVIHPKAAAVYDPTQEAQDLWEEKEEELQLFEALRKATSGTSPSPSSSTGAGVPQSDDDDGGRGNLPEEMVNDQTFTARLKATMLNNLDVSVTNVRVVYEDAVTNPEVPIDIHTSITQFRLVSCDSDYQPAFAASSSKIFYKLAELEGFEVSIVTPGSGSKREAAVNTAVPISGTVMGPLNLALRLQHQPVPYIPKIPRWRVELVVARSSVRMNRSQWDAVWQSIKFIQKSDMYEAFHRFRPAGARRLGGAADPSQPAVHPRDWWWFAIQSVLHMVGEERRRRRFDWDTYVRVKNMEREYQTLFKRMQPNCPWLSPLSEPEKETVSELERAMPIESIKLSRSLVYARIALEAEQHAARQSFLISRSTSAASSAAPAAPKKGGGWWAWWTGAAGATAASTVGTEPVAETEDEQQEIDRLWGLIDADKWTAEQRRVLAKELGLGDESFAGSPQNSSPAAQTSSTPLLVTSTHAFVRVQAFFVELLDYDQRPFASLSVEDVCVAGRTVPSSQGQGGFEIRAYVSDFSVNDVALSKATSSVMAAAPETIKPIARFARERLSNRTLMSSNAPRTVTSSLSSATAQDSTVWIPTAFRCPDVVAVDVTYTKPAQRAQNTEADFDASVRIHPMDIRMSVPWMQRVVAFWGVDTKLVVSAPKNTTNNSNIKVPDDNPAVQKSLLLTELMSKAERRLITSISMSVTDLSFVIPEESRDEQQETRIHVGELRLTNTFENALRRRSRFSVATREGKRRSQIRRQLRRQRTMSLLQPGSAAWDTAMALQSEQSIGLSVSSSSSAWQPGTTGEGEEEEEIEMDDGDPSSDVSLWTDEVNVALKGLTIHTSWAAGSFDTRLLGATTLHITVQSSLIPTYRAIPVLSLQCIFPANEPPSTTAARDTAAQTNSRSCDDVVFEAPMESYAVFFSAFTALTDFFNNASGRGTDVDRGAAAKATTIHDEFVCRVRGPDARFPVADESLLTPQQRYFAQSVPVAQRLVEVSRGCLALYHEKRPSMVFAKLELKPDMFHVLREGCDVTLFVSRGGRHPVVREHLSEAREILVLALDLPDVDALRRIPLPQLWFMVGDYCDQTTKSGGTVDDIQSRIDEVLGSYAIVEEASHTQPCQCVTMTCRSEKEANRLERVIVQSAAVEGFPPPLVTAEEAAQQVQRSSWDEPHREPKLVDLMCAFEKRLVLRVRPKSHLDSLVGAALGSPSLCASDPTTASTTTEGHLEIAIDNLCTHLILTRFSREIVFGFDALAISGRDDDANEILGEQNENVLHRVVSFGGDPSVKPPSTSPSPSRRARELATVVAFESSWVSNTTPTMSLRTTAPVNMVLNDHFAAASELLWDLLGVMMMKSYAVTTWKAIPWVRDASEGNNNANGAAAAQDGGVTVREDLIDRMVLDLECLGGLHVDMEYERGGCMPPYAAAGATDMYSDLPKVPVMPRGRVAALSGKHLQLRWRSNELINETSLRLGCPELRTYFPQPQPTPYTIFLSPWCRRPREAGIDAEGVNQSDRNDAAAASSDDSHVNVSYTITYPPSGVPEVEWRERAGSAHTGFHYTHFLSIALNSVCCRYWQRDLWALTEYFTNGVVSRLGHVAVRHPFQLEKAQHLWPPPPDAPPPSYTTAMLHKHIEVTNSDLCLPYDAQQPPQLWGYVKHLSFWDRIEADRRVVLEPHGGVPFECSDVRTGFMMNVSGLKIWATKSNTPQSRFDESAVLLRPTDENQTEAVVDELSLDYSMWFEATLMVRRDDTAAKSIIIQLPEVHFHGSSEQLAFLLDWMSGVFIKSPWQAFYPPKPTPLGPLLPNLAAREGRRWTTFEYIIEADRLMLHLRDPATPYPAVPQIPATATIERHPINVVIDLAEVAIRLSWFNDGAFRSLYAVKHVEMWDLLHAAWKSQSDMFIKSPKEMISTSQLLLKLAPPKEKPQSTVTPADCSGDSVHVGAAHGISEAEAKYRKTCGLSCVFGWTPDTVEKVVFSNTLLGQLEIDVLPRFLFEVRDSLCSLRVRNAFAPLCKWPQVVPFESPPPWDPQTQLWGTHHTATLEALTVMLFDQTSERRPKPSFVLTLQDISYAAESAKFHERARWELTVQQIAQNGVCDTTFATRPIIVPQRLQRTGGASGSSSDGSAIFSLQQDAASGTRGFLGCVWIFAPQKEQFRRLKATLSDPSLQDLAYLGHYAEERFCRRQGWLPPSEVPAPQPDDSSSHDIRFAIHNPCLVVTEHESLWINDMTRQRGVVINFGELEVQSTFSAPTSHDEEAPLSPRSTARGSHPSARKGFESTEATAPVMRRVYRFSLKDGHMKSLHQVSSATHLVEPLSVIVEGDRYLSKRSLSDPLAVREESITVRVQLDGLSMIVPQEAYESVLRSVVRHWLVDDEDRVKQKASEAADSASTTRSAGARSTATGFAPHAYPRSVVSGSPTSPNGNRPRAASSKSSGPVDIAIGSHPSASSSARLDPVSNRTVYKLQVAVEWKHLRLSVYNDTVGVTFAVGPMTMLLKKCVRPRSPPETPSLEADPFSSIAFAETVDTDPLSPAQASQPANSDFETSATDAPQPTKPLSSEDPATDNGGSNEKFASDVPLASAAQTIQTFADRVANPQRGEPTSPRSRKRSKPVSLKGRHSSTVLFRTRPPPLDEEEVALHCTVEYLRLGVDGHLPILNLDCRDSAKNDHKNCTTQQQGSNHDNSGDVYPPLSFDYIKHDRSQDISADLGVTKVLVEHHSLVQAISFLYDPYRRIVLPKYTAFEVREVSDDFTLSTRLLLSSRSILRVSSNEKNHVTLDGNGHSIHFLDDASGKASIVLESGLTLRIVNATIYLYGKPLDHYVTAGNGSYVVLDDLLTNVIAGTSQVEAEGDTGSSDDDDNNGDDLEGSYGERSLVTVRTFRRIDTAGSGNDSVPLTKRQKTAKTPVVWVPRDSSMKLSLTAAFSLLVPEARVSGTVAPPAPASPTPSLASARTNSTTGGSSSRALMLSAAVQLFWLQTVKGGNLTELGTFDLTQLEAECQYLEGLSKVDYSSLISPWSIQIKIDGRKTLQTDSANSKRTAWSGLPSAPSTVAPSGSSKMLRDVSVRHFLSPHERSISVMAPTGVDLRLRYGDLQLSLAAVQHAQAAFGHLETNVLATAKRTVDTSAHEFAFLEDEQGSNSASPSGTAASSKTAKKAGVPLDDDDWDIAPATPEEEKAIEAQYFNHASSVTKVTTKIVRVGLYLVDDSSSMDFPLFYASWRDIETPTFESHDGGRHAKYYVKLSMQLEYYNFYASAWSRFLEPMPIELVVRDVPNQSLQDVQARRGFRRTGVRLGSVRLHFSPMAADALSRAMRLMKRLTASTSSTSTTNNNPVSGTGPSSASPAAASNSQEFFAYEIKQQLGPDIIIGFAQDDQQRFPQSRTLSMMETFPFNFPRIDGRELPASQHYVTVTTEYHTSLLQISRVGLQILQVHFGGIPQEVVVDIQVHEGKKVVILRTNLAFHNMLPFAVALAGVGSVFSNASLNVPTESMRRRCEIMPQVPHRCHPVSMGLTYDALPNHYDQTFLCTAVIDEARTQQQAVYFLLRFAPQLKVTPDSHLYDCRVHLEAPFSIVNRTGLPITAGLHYKQYHMKSRSGVLDFTSKFYFVHVESVDIAAEGTAPITQVDPLRDIFLDIAMVQTSGTPLGRAGAKRQVQPALIRCDKKATRDTSLLLHDPNGETVLVRIEYADQQVILWVPYWFVNQTPHYLQIMDSNPRRRGFPIAGMATEGLPPSSSPMVFGSEKAERLKEKAHVYVRVGRRTDVAAWDLTARRNTAAADTQLQRQDTLMWSQWSDALAIHPIGEWSVLNCGETETVTLAYSIQFVGGAMKDTRVICFTPRWIVLNRTPFVLNVRQVQVRSSEVEENWPLPAGNSRLLDVATLKQNANAIQVRLAPNADEGVLRCQWSQLISTEVFGDQNLNIRFLLQQNSADSSSNRSGSRSESHVFHVSTYRRGSIMYISVERAAVPPYIIENRTPFMVHAKQRDATGKLVVYPHVSKGFVWDDSEQSPVLTVWLSEGTAAASRAITINLEASLLVNKRTRFQLQQEVQLPGGVVVYVRVRAMQGSFAISVCLDNHIDKMRLLPFFQFSLQVHVDSIYALVSSTQSDVMLLTIKPIHLSVRQECPSTSAASPAATATTAADADEQLVELSIGVIQMDDERTLTGRKERVVMQLIGSTEAAPSMVRLQRRMQRLTPILHITALEVHLHPIEMHVEDSFLFDVLRLSEHMADTIFDTNGGGRETSSAIAFEATPWRDETERTVAMAASANNMGRNEDAFSNKIAFIEKLQIEHFFLSVSLYRSHDRATDPIRERLGFLSVLIRSVQDAHIDWRRLEQTNIYDSVWLLATLYSNFYLHTLQQQVLNVLHVAGLDVMRGFVTDLLSQYFNSTATTQVDRARPRVPRRAEAQFLEDLEREAGSVAAPGAGSPIGTASALGPRSPRSVLLDRDDGTWDTMEDAPQVVTAGRWLKLGSNIVGGLANAVPSILGKAQYVSMETLAHQVPWHVFVEQVNDEELKQYGHHAMCHAIRTRSFATHPPSSKCKRCGEIDWMRQRRIEASSMSALPHPSSQELTWDEFTHHVSWDEFVAICVPQEVRRYANLVRDGVLGKPQNVIRIDGGLMWVIRE